LDSPFPSDIATDTNEYTIKVFYAVQAIKKGKMAFRMLLLPTAQYSGIAQ
jgi:hypothetical protein